MADRGTIRSEIYGAISQVEGSSDFPATEINAFIDEGIRFVAPLIKWPRKRATIPPVQGTIKYSLFADAVLIISAYFGDPAVGGDLQPLDILTEQALASIVPGWFSTDSSNQGRPRRIILEDRTHVSLNPVPDAASAASGKLIHIGYVYLPASLTNDSDIPDLPTTYHDLLVDYGKYKCYNGRLNNPQEADRNLKAMIEKSKMLEPIITKEFDIQGMTWGKADSMDDEGWGINFY